MKNKVLKMYSAPQSDNNQALLYSISHDNVLNRNDMRAYKHFCTFTEIFILVCASVSAPVLNKAPNVPVSHSIAN